MGATYQIDMGVTIRIVASSGAMDATVVDVFMRGAAPRFAVHFLCLTLTPIGYRLPAPDNSRQGEIQCSKEPSQHER